MAFLTWRIVFLCVSIAYECWWIPVLGEMLCLMSVLTELLCRHQYDYVKMCINGEPYVSIDSDSYWKLEKLDFGGDKSPFELARAYI